MDGMKIEYGNGTTEYGPGVLISLTGNEVAIAITAWLHAHSVHIDGSKTVRVNGALCSGGDVYVDPSSRVVAKGKEYSGRGPK
jgi:hypothetical protein